MVSNFWLIFLGFIQLGFGQGSPSRGISPEVLSGALSVANSIVEKFPPEKFHVIGLGRSPTLVTTILKIKSDHYCTNLPLSNAKPEYGPINQGDVMRVLDVWEEIIKPDEFAGKEIVLLDFAASGATLENGRRFLVKLIDERLKLSLKVIVVAMTRIRERSLAEVVQSLSLNPQNLGLLDLTDHYEFEQSMYNSNELYEYYAEFGKFDPRADSVELRNAERHHSLKRLITEYLNREALRSPNCGSRFSKNLIRIP